MRPPQARASERAPPRHDLERDPPRRRLPAHAPFYGAASVREDIPISSDRIHLAPSSWCTFEAAGFVVITFVPQIAVADPNAEELPSYHRNVDNDESVFVHHDESGGRKPGMLSHTPHGILHGADEATRAAFQKRRVPGMRRTLCGVSVDTDRPLAVSTVYERLTL